MEGEGMFTRMHACHAALHSNTTHQACSSWNMPCVCHMLPSTIICLCPTPSLPQQAYELEETVRFGGGPDQQELLEQRL